jgi:hypothetical protein
MYNKLKGFEGERVFVHPKPFNGGAGLNKQSKWEFKATGTCICFS